MAKDRLRRRFEEFAGRLTPGECREQLVLAYLQMERCIRVLRGEKTEPVEMADNGESTDLELFYACRKRVEELAWMQAELQGAETALEEALRAVDEMYDERFYGNEGYERGN